MKMTGSEMMNDSGLDDLLLQAASTPRVASNDLLGRVLVDAYALQPAPRVANTPPIRVPLFARLFAGLGGVGGLAGLTAVALGGVWIGFSEPDSLTSVAENFWSDSTAETVELIPDLDTFLTEG